MRKAEQANFRRINDPLPSQPVEQCDDPITVVAETRLWPIAARCGSARLVIVEKAVDRLEIAAISRGQCEDRKALRIGSGPQRLQKILSLAASTRQQHQQRKRPLIRRAVEMRPAFQLDGFRLPRLRPDWSERHQYKESVKSSASVGFGPFSIGGSYGYGKTEDKFNSDYQNGEIRVPGMQIVAWVSRLIPLSPQVNVNATVAKEEPVA